ncbi:MAG: 30S ribosomal protein S19e [Candidatus Woesearchaeota archaeon]|jgi:small subunit ribosomal protein S19e|nr:30S ribosomal protein S19e [Candidatus Woesearchaeota archaeon]MDP7182063.1 30S ribosomal protein S19e [Candidatus Woesearchaeota archaeon]MDP7198665.1 30S ribosomal protein S19e [Candidatus Woesearchaeota archaeon]MDP7467639.1 30S ribosomal protein S19e [Candidatus Woesearchaeota archaeon]MDP7647143.1 30S ribosomal protein S19e [Candidatus Woesearchaeota archaeon]|tara:strand:- start:155 stop:760 length:606 start_codon:yes stop_codon:yes gene_type:complete
MAIYDVPIGELLTKTAEELKSVKELTPPEWSVFAKTGQNKTRPPMNPDWWYVRAASILRKVAIRGPIGTSKLRTLYGGRKRRGYKQQHFVRASGSVIRAILKQLDAAGLTKTEAKKIRRGRELTPQGMALLDKVSVGIMKQKNIVLPPKKKDDVKPIKKKAAKKAKKTKKIAKEAPKEPKPAAKPKAEPKAEPKEEKDGKA